MINLTFDMNKHLLFLLNYYKEFIVKKITPVRVRIRIFVQSVTNLNSRITKRAFFLINSKKIS